LEVDGDGGINVAMARGRQPVAGPWLRIVLVAALVVVATEWLTPRTQPMPAAIPLVLNVLAFASLVVLAVGLTNRAVFSIALVTVAYELVVVCNRFKIRYLATPLHPADLFSVSNIVHVNLFPRHTVLGLIGLGIAVSIGLSALFRVSASAASPLSRIFAALLSIAFLAGLATTYRYPSAVAFLQSRGVASYTPNPTVEVEFNGLLLNLLLHASDLHVSAPPGYGEAAVERVMSKLSQAPVAQQPAAVTGPVNLVIFVVEAMMDPADLGWKFTSDPLPFFHALRERFSSGWAYSPEVGGRSANPEFELLSGLATYYLPRDSVPYMTFVSRPLPALPRFFTERGYHASALHVDTLAFFNYVEVYRDFGFSDARTVRSKPGVSLDAAGRVPSDEALVDFVIEVSRESPQYFLFAFTNATHLPYDYEAYLASDLDIVDPLPPPIRREVKTYVNALRAADRAIAKLIHHFEASKDRVVVAILGDHLPGLSAEAMSHSLIVGAKNWPDGMALSHRCPVVLWSNVGAPKRDFSVSFNFLGQRLLAEMGIAPTGIWRANAAQAAQTPVLSKFVETADGRRYLPPELPPDEAAQIRDYGLIQYDLLFGEQYALRRH
jgi:phosphoglycerol transferase MdoB-like AlkP superfamily enzyme